ncbi:MAG: hypothetical protein M3326_07345, partial [Actinomycetota bacterium]|nr:hypothetical protein [Actinomycetota bacterium]
MIVPTVTVLPMVPKDLDYLYETCAEVIQDGGGMPAEPGVPTPEAFDEGWIPNRAVFVAWSGCQRVRSYFVRSNFPAFAAHIAQSGYIVVRETRGRGTGSLLLADSLRVARDLGYRAM